MVEYMTSEQARQRSGMAFFEAEGRMERILELNDRVPGAMFDEVWVSAHEDGAHTVEGGRVLGMRVVVTVTMPKGEIRMWSDLRKEFLS